ncbi:hypothetical protein L535_1595 [Bordetella bronchiseptica SBL-F6116]|nr:hypothetical protein L492_1594 [Bordetella bronchiseptica 7E71]KDD98100.1 hypothetical protein L535_1595 [Bordetella bronchiseptica SBL-F6116]CFW32574.1 Uncharacterised protein [Bordetella pertussis]
MAQHTRRGTPLQRGHARNGAAHPSGRLPMADPGQARRRDSRHDLVK